MFFYKAFFRFSSRAGVWMKIKTIFEGEQMESSDIYSEDSREELVENDEIEPCEAAFMKGYDEAI